MQINYCGLECVECVGCSNNTIRAGLTPKYVDRQNLIKVLNYRMTDPEFYMVKPNPLPNTPNIVEFAPNDCEDFTLHEIQVSTLYVIFVRLVIYLEFSYYWFCFLKIHNGL